MRTAPMCAGAPLALALLTACGGDVPTEAVNTPAIRLVAGSSVTDTVAARPLQPLVIEVRGADGKALQGAAVRVAAIPLGGEWAGGQMRDEVAVAYLSSDPFGGLVSGTTNAQGQVSFRVIMGPVAGPGRVVVSVPALGLQDTARFTIRPGAPAAVRSEPADTALFIGRTLKLRATVIDRFGNRRDDPLAFSVTGVGASVSEGTVSGSSFGRAAVIARAGERSDTSYVSVVPQATIAAYGLGNSNQRLSLFTLDLDGSNLKKVRDTQVGAEMPAAWSTDGKHLVYQDTRADHTRQLYVHEMESGASRRFLAAADQMEVESWPRRSWDGEWVYFAGGNNGERHIYRARRDGTGKERISPAGAPYQWEAAPSPDGRQVAYVTHDFRHFGTLEVMSLGTRQATRIGILGMSPRWSPTGAEIAYLEHSESYLAGYGKLMAARPDGTGIRSLTRSNTAYMGPFDFSPDGRYIVATTEKGVLTVVEVASGTEIPVRLPATDVILRGPTWKP